MSALVRSGSETIPMSGTPARLKSTPLLRSKCVLFAHVLLQVRRG